MVETTNKKAVFETVTFPVYSDEVNNLKVSLLGDKASMLTRCTSKGSPHKGKTFEEVHFTTQKEEREQETKLGEYLIKHCTG